MFSLMSLISKRSISSAHGGYDNVAIRLAGPEDDPAIGRVAALDGKSAPSGRVLVAEADGEVIAALAIDGRDAVADPFRWTRDVVALMEMRAEQMGEAAAASAPASAQAVGSLRTQLT